VGKAPAYLGGLRGELGVEQGMALVTKAAVAVGDAADVAAEGKAFDRTVLPEPADLAGGRSAGKREHRKFPGLGSLECAAAAASGEWLRNLLGSHCWGTLLEILRLESHFHLFQRIHLPNHRLALHPPSFLSFYPLWRFSCSTWIPFCLAWTLLGLNYLRLDPLE